MFTVRGDVKEVDRYLSAVERKQLPFATALALTRTAQHIQKKTLPRILPKIFDRPTRWTLRGFYVIPATKRRLEAVVQIKDGTVRDIRQAARGGKIGTPAFNYLAPQIKGGKRRAKRHEIALRAMAILGPDEYTVPGKGMKLNAFGNLTGNTYSKILADVNNQSYGDRGDDIAHGFGQRTTTRGKRKYFYDPNLRPRAIWMRYGRGRIKPALIFVKSPTYKKRFDFDGIGRRAAEKRWPIEFRKAMARALATAR